MPLKGRSGEDLLRDVYQLPESWGPWTVKRAEYPAQFPALVYRDSRGNEQYAIDLAQINSGSELADCIYQASGKGWVSETDLGHLVRALGALFSPQANLCSQGVNLTIDAVEHLKKRFELADQAR
jgi:hypothetical protein